jgi:hypothetical protein
MRHSRPPGAVTVGRAPKVFGNGGDLPTYWGSAVTTPTPPAAAVSRNTSFRCPPTPPSNPSLNTGPEREQSPDYRQLFWDSWRGPERRPTGSARGLSASPRHPCTAAVAWPTARIDRPRPDSGAYHWDAPRDAYRWLAVRRPWLRGLRQ